MSIFSEISLAAPQEKSSSEIATLVSQKKKNAL